MKRQTLAIVALTLLLLFGIDRMVPEFHREDLPDSLQARMSSRWPVQLDPSVVMVGIDDDVYTQDRFNRKEHARLIDALTKAGARSIFLDIVFEEERGPEWDVPLTEAITRSQKVIVAGAYQAHADVSDEPRRPLVYPALQRLIKSGLCRLAIINASNTGDKSSSMVAYHDLEEGELNPWGPGLRLSPAASLLASYRHFPDDAVQATPANRLSGALLKIPPQSFEVESLVLSRYNEQGPTLIGYKSPILLTPPATGPAGHPGSPGTIPVISYLKVVDGDPQALQAVAGKFVLVGDTSSRDDDVYDTPVGRIKGVEIHANLLNTLLLDRVPQLPWAGSTFGNVCNVLVVTLCILAAWAINRQSSPRSSILVALGMLVLWETLVWYCDHQGYFLPQNTGERSLILSATVTLCLRYFFTVRVLRRFLPDEIVRQLEYGEEIVQGPVHATVMVTDIRGYTTLSESRTPSEVLTLLNDYHSETVRHYQKYGGYVLNYQGDAQIVLFGHPKKQADPALQAVRAAQGASASVEALRRYWKLPEGQTFNVGAGICTGTVVIADLGADQREYTVIGELVRKAHKLQSLSEILGANIILDAATYEGCCSKPEVEVREIQLDSSGETVKVYVTDLTSSAPATPSTNPQVAEVEQGREGIP